MNKRVMVLGSLLLWCFTNPVSAQVLPFFTNTAQTVGFESNAVRTVSRFVLRNKLEREGEEIEDPSNQDVLVFAQIFGVPIRIDSETVLIGMVPVSHKELDLALPGVGRKTLSDEGLADTTILLKRRFYVDNFQSGGFQMAAIGGIKLPTGDNDERDETGELLPRSLQLGTGSVDVPLGIILSAFKNRIGFNSELIYQFNNESEGFAFGDETKINLAVGYRLLPKVYQSMQDRVLNAYLELNSSFSQTASLNGQPLSESGGTLIFLTPGIQWILSPRFLVEAAFQIPVLQQLNGTQLTFAPTTNLGIRLQF